MSEKKKRSIFSVINEYFGDLDDWFERFREELIEKPSWNRRSCTMEPLRNIAVTPTEVVITVDLPYADESEIQVKPLGKDTVDISAKMRRKIRFHDLGITHLKGEFQTLQCQTRIPVPVCMETIRVRFKRGILEIRLPRKHEHEIPVK